MIGFDYHADTLWEMAREFPPHIDALSAGHKEASILADSIGEYFTMKALTGRQIAQMQFFSPVMDMEKLIRNLMDRAGLREQELFIRGKLPIAGGEILSGE